MRTSRLLTTSAAALAYVLTALVLAPSSLAQPASDPPVTVAVVAHRSVSVGSLGPQHLRDILLGERQHWPAANVLSSFVLVRDRHGISSSRASYVCPLRRTSRRWPRVNTEARSWTALGSWRPPAALRRLVAQTPGGLGFLPLEAVDPSVAVVSIDGHAPDQRGYVLRVE